MVPTASAGTAAAAARGASAGPSALSAAGGTVEAASRASTGLPETGGRVGDSNGDAAAAAADGASDSPAPPNPCRCGGAFDRGVGGALGITLTGGGGGGTPSPRADLGCCWGWGCCWGSERAVPGASVASSEPADRAEDAEGVASRMGKRAWEILREASESGAAAER